MSRSKDLSIYLKIHKIRTDPITRGDLSQKVLVGYAINKKHYRFFVRQTYRDMTFHDLGRSN